MIDLDTNFLIDALVPNSPQEGQLVGWLLAGESLGMSAVAWGEFLCGPLSPAAESLARILSVRISAFEQAGAEKAAELFNQTGRRSRTFADCCIAATAMLAGAKLATSNQNDFAPFVSHGLILA